MCLCGHTPKEQPTKHISRSGPVAVEVRPLSPLSIVTFLFFVQLAGCFSDGDAESIAVVPHMEGRLTHYPANALGTASFRLRGSLISPRIPRH